MSGEDGDPHFGLCRKSQNWRMAALAFRVAVLALVALLGVARVSGAGGDAGSCVGVLTRSPARGDTTAGDAASSGYGQDRDRGVGERTGHTKGELEWRGERRGTGLGKG